VFGEDASCPVEFLHRVRMLHNSIPSGGPALRSRRRNHLDPVVTTAALAAVLCPLTLAGLSIRIGAPVAASPGHTGSLAPEQEPVVVASLEAYDWVLDPTPSLLGSEQTAPLGAAFKSPSVTPEAAPLMPSPPQEGAQPLPPLPEQQTIQPLQAAPLPVPRPSELRSPRAADLPQTASVPASRRSGTAALPAAPADNRSLLEKLFGVQPAPGSALGYAALESNAGNVAPSNPFRPAPSLAADAATAVYDISARVVYMPNGERLEAHSGLGDKLDDPRYVHVRMSGATPPGTYDLTEREKLFHGVRALRLNPVGGGASVYGRAGLLAHTYMLGPNGDSNGCVSFKQYDKFLQAFLRGEVKRLVVVTGRGQDLLPSIGDNRIGTPERSALRNDT
jgi:hypothetical protein